MASSGQLGLKMAEAFGLPHSTVITAIKALRAGRALSIKGRGSSAAQMTVADAAAITVGIMSAAVSAEIPSVTKRLLEMPCRHFVRPGSTADSKLLAPPSHRFVDGFCVLFDGEWELGGTSGDAYSEMDGVRIVLGVDGSRNEGFAVIETRDADGASVKNFYSTLPLRTDVPASENPEGLGLGLYRDPPKFVFAASVDGRALSALKRALAEPVSARRTTSERAAAPSEDA